jgi:hypothetical protein
MSGWIEVPLEQLSRPSSHVEPRGLQSFRSPFDVPAAVRSRYDEKNRKFIIEFAYISSEQTEPRAVEPTVVVSLGRNSSRIFRVELGVSKEATMQSIQAMLSEVFRTLLIRVRNAPSDSYEAARDAVDLERGELFRELKIA